MEGTTEIATVDGMHFKLPIHSVIAVCTLALSGIANSAAQDGHWLTGYYPIYTQNGTMSPTQLDYTKLTHVIYWGVEPTSAGGLNTTKYVSPSTFASGATTLVAQAHAAGAKALIGIGGDQADGYSLAFNEATTPENLSAFVDSIVSLMQEYNFDGVDINWEQIGYYAGDDAQFPAFIEALRTQLNTLTPTPLLTMAPETHQNGGRPDLIGPIYQDFDQINIQTYLMSFTYCGWETYYNSPLNNGGLDFVLDAAEPLPSVYTAVTDYTKTYATIPISKLGMGIQLAGVVWQGGAGTSTGGVTEPLQTWTNDNNCNLNSNPAAPSQSVIPYTQVVPYTTMAGYTVNIDNTADQSWLSYDPSNGTATNEAEDQFISYESPASISKKGTDLASSATQTLLGGSMGGVMLFELSGDYTPTAEGDAQHPLITAANGMQSLLPGPVTNLTDTLGATSATLNWSAATAVVSYNVYEGNGPTGTPTNVTTNQATLSNLTPGQQYQFYVAGVDAFGLGTGAEVSFEIPAANLPSGVSATAGVNQVTVTWSPVLGATGYSVLRSTTSGSGYGAPVAASSPYIDKTVTAGTTYYYVVTSKGSWGTSGFSNQSSATPLAPLPAPTGLQVTTSPGSVKLTWNSVANATSYDVWSNTQPGSGSPTIKLGFSPTTTFTYNANFNGTTTYYFSVSSVVGSYVSPLSSQVSAKPPVPLLNAPGTPVAVPGADQVQLTWIAVTGATGYYVLRSTTSGTGYSQLVTSGQITAPTYTDTTAYSGLTYYYVVEAFNASGAGHNSPQVSAKPTIPAPTGLSDSVANEVVTLSWNAVPGVSGYEVVRGTTSGGPYTIGVGSVSAPTTTLKDSTALPGTTYYYAVEAYYFTAGGLSAIWSPYSSPVTVTVVATELPAPTGLQAVIGQGGYAVNLLWSKIAGAASYNILRATTNGSGYTPIGTSPYALYTDATGSPGTTYYYVVQAVNSVGPSPDSNQASIAIPVLKAPPEPNFVNVSVKNGVLTVNSFGSETATSYSYYRSTSLNGTYAPIMQNSSAYTYIDTSAATGVQYYYEMSASNSIGTSPITAPVSGEIPPAPSGLNATAGNSQVALSWTAVTTDISSYSVFRGTIPGSITTPVGSPTTNSFSDTTVTGGTLYYYQVQTIGSDGVSTSTLSAIVSATPTSTVVAAPTALNATSVNAAGAVTLNWTASAGSTSAYSYSIYGGNTEGGEGGAALTTVTNNATTATVTGLASNKNWYFIVKAVFGASTSVASNEVLALPRILWIPDYAGSLVQVRIGGGTTTTAITVDLPSCNPNSLAVNQNKLYVVCNSDWGAPDKILVYNAATIRAASAGTLTISPTKTITSGDFSSLIGIAFDSSNDLWVASNGNNDVLELTAAQLATATPAAIVSLSNSPGSPAGLAFDADGSLWVTGEFAGGILLNFTTDQFGTGADATPRYCAVTQPQGGICISQANLFLEPEGVAVFNGGVWVANNSTTGSNELDGATPGRQLVNLAVVGGDLTVKGIYGTVVPDTGGTATSPFLCPGGLFATGVNLWVNDESYGEATPQCGANGDSASQTGGVFSFTSAELMSEPATQAPTFTNVTGRPGFGGVYVENDR